MYSIRFLIPVVRKTETDIFVKFNEWASSLTPFRVLLSFPIHNFDNKKALSKKKSRRIIYVPFEKMQTKIINIGQK